MKRTPLKRGTKQMKRAPFKANPSIVKKKRVVGQIGGNKKKSKTKPKKKSLAKYKKELDAVFSKYIRNRDRGQCFTCSHKNDPKKMQCGHFVPRQYLSVRYDERNCNCQCYACNMIYGGQGATYAIRLAQKYGQETVDFLESQRWVTTKLDESWYQEKIKEYTEKLKDMCIT